MRMFSTVRQTIVLTAVCALALPAIGQGSKADYERAAELGEHFRGKVSKQKVTFAWVDNGEGVWYRRDLGRGRGQWFSIDPSSSQPIPLKKPSHVELHEGA